MLLVQIQVSSVFDVQAAIAFSELTGVRLSVKNKGHDYKGRSAGKNTLSLWVSVTSRMIIWAESDWGYTL